MLSQSIPQRVCKSEKATVKCKYLKRKYNWNKTFVKKKS